MINVTGLGIYTSSVFKDLVCCPRPFSPPVIRLCESSELDDRDDADDSHVNTCERVWYEL